MKTSELKKWYNQELKRRDELIDKLKKENELIFKSALKQSEKIVKLTEKLEQSLTSKKSKVYTL